MGTIQLNEDFVAVYKYMTIMSANILSPTLIFPSDLRKLLTEVERDLIGHPKLGLPASYDGKIFWPTVNY